MPSIEEKMTTDQRKQILDGQQSAGDGSSESQVETSDEQDDDVPVWLTGEGEFIPYPELDDHEVIENYYFSLDQAGYHADKTADHHEKMNGWLERARQLKEEAGLREVPLLDSSLEEEAA